MTRKPYAGHDADEPALPAQGSAQVQLDRPLGLNREQVQNLLSDLDDAEATAALDPASARRRHRRVNLHRYPLPVLVQDPGGGGRRLVGGALRNISVSGLSFLHSGFLHRGTRCLVTLGDVSGVACSLAGSVANCRLVRGNIHEIGLQLDENIDLRRFVPNLPDKPLAAESVDPKSVSGHVVLLGIHELDQALLRIALAGSSVKLVSFPDAKSAASELRQPRTIAVIDADAGADRTSQLLQAARAEQASLPVLLLSAEPASEPAPPAPVAAPASEATKEEAGSSAATPAPVNPGRPLPKPFERADVLRILAELLPPLDHTPRIDDDAVICELPPEDPRMALVGLFLGEAHGSVDRLRAAAKSGDTAALRAACLRIRGNAAPLGFPSLAACADQVLQRLKPGQPPCKELSAAVSQLAGSCERAHAA